MCFYIDPGTGSMLFTVLVGILGASIYGLRNLVSKVKFILSAGKQEKVSEKVLPFVVYTDDKRYYNTFGPILREFDRRKQPVVYMTASQDDPCFQEKFQYVTCQFIGEGNKGFAKLNLLRADVVLATTPGLDVLQWKRSRDVKYYAHVLHMPNDALYRMYGLDYFDAVLLSGEYQIGQIRELEQLRGLPAKDLEIVGMPYLDELQKRYEQSPRPEAHPTTVLLAPTWGKNGALNRYGSKLIQALLNTGYQVVIRPHPQSFTSEKEMIDRLMKEFPDGDQLQWNRDNDNFDILNRADILFSDFSGVVFDYCLVFGKPLIYMDLTYDKAPYDGFWLKEEMWTLETLPKIGYQLQGNDIENLKPVIDRCLESQDYRDNIAKAREECWNHRGEGAVRTVDFLIARRNQILGKGEENHAV